MGLISVLQLLPIAAQGADEQVALLPFYIGIGVVVAVIVLAALIATPSSRRRAADERPGKARSPESLRAEAEGTSRQGGDANRWF
ncbi:MAG: hypothetical protein KY437_02155 [Actinobacteria bacterium]|nr:hypothetical protein [Actinomycetota bacterium]